MGLFEPCPVLAGACVDVGINETGSLYAQKYSLASRQRPTRMAMQYSDLMCF